MGGISDARTGPDGQVLDGTALARMYYTAGLQLDGKHPHLLTNLGSLLKDQGQAEQAIKCVISGLTWASELTQCMTTTGCTRRPSSRNRTLTLRWRTWGMRSRISCVDRR